MAKEGLTEKENVNKGVGEREGPVMQLPGVRAMWIERHMQSRKWPERIWRTWQQSERESRGHIVWAPSAHSKDSASTPDGTGASRGCEQRSKMIQFFFLL